MKVPLLQKIEIQDISPEAINLIFDRNPIGVAPIIFILDEVVLPHKDIFVKNCIKIFKERGISPYFPFPCYLLSNERIENKAMPQLRSIEDAPKHFIKKIKRVKSREQSLLSKADTYQSRTQNHSVTKDLEYLKRKREDNRKLRDLCHEKNFCISLLEKMKSLEI